MNLKTVKFMSDTAAFYEKENITVLVGLNHTPMLSNNHSFQLNESIGYLNKMVFNANGQKIDKVSNIKAVGYAF